MISKAMKDALNEQIREEVYSAYLYMSMSSYATCTGLPGVANWFFVQMQEELTHAQRFYNYVSSQGEQAVFEAIDKPPAKFKSALGMFEAGLAHEKHITACINKLANLARKEKDHATAILLQWFVTEQVEEEENANDVIVQLKLAGDQGGGLFMIDKELSTRVFVPPADLAKK